MMKDNMKNIFDNLSKSLITENMIIGKPVPKSSNVLDPRFTELNRKFELVKKELRKNYLSQMEEYLKEMFAKKNYPVAIMVANYFDDDQNRYFVKFSVVKIEQSIEDEEEFYYSLEEEEYLEEPEKFNSNELRDLFDGLFPPDSKDVLLGCFRKDNQNFILKNENLIKNL